MKPSTRIKLAPYLFIAPFFIAYAIFGLYPSLYGFWLSLHTGINKYVFSGFRNFQMVLTDEMFWKSMWNGVQLTMGSLFIVLPIALGTALLINLPFVAKRKGYFATFFFTPNITSAVAVALVFGLIYNKDFGVLNAALEFVGLERISWLSNPKYTMLSLILLVTWRYLGVNVLFFMAGLQNVPSELIEASKIDGANVYQRFWHITLPLLQPVMMFVVFQAIIGSFNMFSEAYLLGGKGAGPRDSLLFPTMYLYEQAFRSQNFGYSAAIGYVFTVILMLVTLFQLKAFNLKDQGQH
jgi:ABC-type sugar transport system permease subunit